MDRMYAPWRRAFVEGRAADDEAVLPTPTGCIFCDFPRRGKIPDDGDAAAWDRARWVVTCRAEGFVILNKYPYGAGHVMVVPHVHTHVLESLEEATFLGVHRLLRETVAAVREEFRPDGLNVGMNMGKAGGAGIDEHIHYHVLPRWNGDVNFMPALMDTKVISSSLADTYDRLCARLRLPDDA